MSDNVVDRNLLKVLLRREDFNKYYGLVNASMLSPVTAFLLSAYKGYFEKYPSATKLDIAEFSSYLVMFRLQGQTDENKAAYKAIVSSLSTPIDPEVQETMVTRLTEMRLATDIGNALARFHDGEEIDIMDAVSSAQTEAVGTLAAFAGEDYITTDISDVLSKEERNEGLQWRLVCLQRSVRALTGGRFGILAARPDAGKTSFMLSEITNFAKQLPDDQNVVIFNNEGVGEQMLLRCYQAALGVSSLQLVEMNKKGVLRDAYIDAVGRMDKIRIVNAHGYHKGNIETSIKRNNAGLIVFDMLDNVKSFDGGAATHERLEALYQWGRDTCIKYDIPGIATSQVSAEGAGLHFPADHMLKDSKTGKQGACDFIIILGKSDNQEEAPFRWVSVPKNKLQRIGAPKDPRAQVTFKDVECTFYDGDTP